MQCEVCGKPIIGKPHKTIIEGAKMTVCNQCVKLGSAHWEEEAKSKPKQPTRTPKPLIPGKLSTKRPTPITEPTLELIDNFGQKIRQAREKMGLHHKDLGKKINEKISVLKKIENEKMIPNQMLATKLEHALKIKLLVPPSEPKAPKKALGSPPKITFGDLINIKNKEAKTEREPS